MAAIRTGIGPEIVRLRKEERSVKQRFSIKLANLSAALLLFAGAAIAAEVVDVGKYQTQGTMRGPEVQFIDSDRLGADAAGRLGQAQLKEMEAQLLEHEMPNGSSKK